jgi:hypothetical protein
MYTYGTTECTAVQVHANIMYGGSSSSIIGSRRAAVPAIPASQISKRRGQKLVIDPEMGKGQMSDGELCVIASPKRQYVAIVPSQHYYTWFYFTSIDISG